MNEKYLVHLTCVAMAMSLVVPVLFAPERIEEILWALVFAVGIDQFARTRPRPPGQA